MLVRGWLVNELTGSPFQVSLVPVLLFAPMLVFSLLGGELADRFRRTRILAIGESLNAVNYVVFTALVLTGIVEAWHILALTGIYGVTAAILAPARQSLVGDLVRARIQRQAVGLSPAIFNLAQIIGPAAGGLVLATLGPGPAAALGTAFILPAIPIFARLRPVARSPMTRSGSIIENIRDGATYIARHPLLRWYMLAGFVLVITVNAWSALFPSLATDVLGRGAGGLAVLQVSIGIGALFGSVASISLAQKIGEKRLEIFSGFAFAALVGALALSTNFSLSALIAGLAAAVATAYFVTNMVSMQLTADPAYRSRVISVRYVMFGFGPFGMIVIGLLAEFLGVQAALAIAAGSGAVLLLLVSVLLRSSAAEPVQLEIPLPAQAAGAAGVRIASGSTAAESAASTGPERIDPAA